MKPENSPMPCSPDLRLPTLDANRSPAIRSAQRVLSPNVRLTMSHRDLRHMVAVHRSGGQLHEFRPANTQFLGLRRGAKLISDHAGGPPTASPVISQNTVATDTIWPNTGLLLLFYARSLAADHLSRPRVSTRSIVRPVVCGHLLEPHDAPFSGPRNAHSLQEPA